MSPPRPENAAALAWQSLAECEAALRAAIEAADPEALDARTAERRALIDAWLAAFPATAEAAPERARLLRELLARNAALLAFADARRQASARDGAGLLQQQRAIGAYVSAGS